MLHKSKRIAALDGLRGLAVLSVMIRHLVPSLGTLKVAQFAHVGWVGVDLFFVLSGFLITGILLDSKLDEHYFGGFYWRRMLRIWPLYYGLVLAVYVLGPHLRLAAGWNISHYPPLIYIFFLQDVLLPDWGIYPLTPTCSLAIEEQFYLIWPLLVRFTPVKALRRVLIGVLLLSPVLRLWGLHLGASRFSLYTLPWFRLDGLAAGALVAVLLRTSAVQEGSLRKGATLLATAAGVGAAVTLVRHAWFRVDSVFMYSWLAVAFGGVVMLAAIHPRIPFLELKWLRYTGEISYGLYLLHTPAFAVVNVVARRVHPGGGAVLLALETTAKIGLAMAAASLSWYALEKPILRLKEYAARAPRKPARLAAHG